ncbi:MAG: DNA polymerase III subunit chi [Betaproteobacteria bacterium]|jgi:DNA polymerase-3 subunit chi|nr:MAG: DNA polymerase III subunit chi [Betaproteobacteria bacterium]TMH33531.1 MAG: DNA polymerase III subunit chi [Betaproteobacteria bacterium]
MTEVQFHFNVPDRLHYACRLLRKALRAGTPGVTVSAPAATLARLDRALWSFDPQEFLPHLLLRTGEQPPQRMRRTPIWLVERAEQAAQHPVLVHLGDEPAEGFESFARLIEIVSTDDDEREAARRRWKHYAARGYAIEKFEVTA